MSEVGKTVHLDISIWYMEENGKIHLKIKGDTSPTTVGNDPESMRGHPHLFRKLAKCLKEAGALHPDDAGE